MTRDKSHTNEGGLAGNTTSLLVGQQLLIPFVRGETDGHLGNDTSQDSSETLIQTETSLLPEDINTGGNETAGFGLQCTNISNDSEFQIDCNRHSPREPWPAAKAASGP